MIEWYRGVPWDAQALRRACDDSADQAVTEVARGFIEAAKGDPTRMSMDPIYRVVRGQWIAVISRDLIVVGHGVVGEEAQPEPESEKAKGRGPKDYDELIEWIEEAGFAVVRGKKSHRAVLSPQGVRLATLNYSPSDIRSFKNDVASCRRALGISLRRNR